MTEMLLALFPGSVVYEYVNEPDLLDGLHLQKFHAAFVSLSAQNEEIVGVIGRIREFDATTPIVVCAENDALLEDAMWSGASAFLVKPMEAQQLRAAVGCAGEGGA